MNSLLGSSYEQRLQREIELINLKIRELTVEKEALQRQLIKARQEVMGVKDVSRRNSVNRVMVERRIIEALTNKSTMRSYELYQQAKNVTFDLNHNTFRTHLHRMKEKGLIEIQGSRGVWKLSLKSDKR